MREIKIDKIIHGDSLADSLGIGHEDLYLDGDILRFRVDVDEEAVKAALKNNKIPTPKEPTIQEKLERAGIDLDELRVALGL